MIISIIIGIAVLSLFAFIYYRQDKIIKEQTDYIDKIEESLIQNLERIKATYSIIKQLDDKGGFEADDEIGIVFKDIESEIQKLEKELED